MKKKKENKPIIVDDLPVLEADDDPRCKHCGSPFNIKSSYDDEYCSEECFLADQED
jgi:hypothetical protein